MVIFGVLGNPQLDIDGDPVRGTLDAWIPGGYFTAVGTTAEAAAATGFDLVSSGAAHAPASVPATVTVRAGGIAVAVPDIAFPAAVDQIVLHLRPSEATTGMTAPSAARQVTAVSEPGGVVVSWAAPASDGGHPITGYRVRAFSTATGGSVVSGCDTADPAARTCRIGALTDGSTVHVAVAAITALGESSVPARLAARVGEPVTVPSVPRTVKVVAGAKRLDASWSVPTSDGGGPISRYTARAYRTPTGGSPVAACVALRPKLTCAFTGLTGAAPLYVTVAATNEAGIGPATATRVGAAPRVVASAPRSVTATSSKSTVKVTWKAPLSSGNTPITGYRAEVFTAARGGAAAYRCATTGSGRSCREPTLKAGRAYYISVYALNAVGPSTGTARLKVVVKR
jgi:hypothetical protein